MKQRHSFIIGLRFLLLFMVAQVFGAQHGKTEEVVIDFEDVPIRLDPNDDEKINRLEIYEEKGVRFKLALNSAKTRMPGKMMFFPHLSSGRQGLVNAMAREQEIPVRLLFPNKASRVKIRFWGSTGTAARLAAYDDNGKEIGRDELERIPGRKRPEDPIPMFELSIDAKDISYVEFSGPRTGEYLAADEVRFTPVP